MAIMGPGATRLAVVVAIAAPVLAVGLAHKKADSCAGQCRAPYELDVLFRAHTSMAHAEKVLGACSDSPSVVRVDGFARFDGDLQARVLTKTFGRSASTAPLLTCLDARPAVLNAAWPG